MPLRLPLHAEPWEPPWAVDSPARRTFAADGICVLPGLIPERLIAAYSAAYEAAAVSPLGWEHCTPYVEVAELRDLCLCTEMVDAVTHLLGEPPLLHLNLTGWVSTERQWHQDTYLNPPGVGDAYLAAWIALEDIDPDSGPFEWYPGSHRWPVLTREAVFAALSPAERADPDWPRFTEAQVAPLWEQEAHGRRVTPERFLARRGDALFWHPRLVHRGSAPRRPGMLRRALIAHYSGVGHRPDMPVGHRRAQNGGWWYAPPTDVPVRRP